VGSVVLTELAIGGAVERIVRPYAKT
jgi:hypothetical protein